MEEWIDLPITAKLTGIIEYNDCSAILAAGSRSAGDAILRLVEEIR
jgi:hypothetical protein